MQAFRKKITSPEYLRNTINFIHQNPVSHSFVKYTYECKYSSYASIKENKATKIDKAYVLELFGNKDNFILYHNEKSIEKYALEIGLFY